MSVWTAVSTTVLVTVIVLIHKGVSSAAVALITQWTQMDNAYRCATLPAYMEDGVLVLTYAAARLDTRGGELQSNDTIES